MFAEINRELYDLLPFVLTTLGENAKQSPIDRPKGFDSHHFIWVQEGEGLFTAGGEAIKLVKNQGMFFRRDFPHKYEGCGAGMDTAWCTFRGGDGVLDYYHVPGFFTFTVPKFLPAATKELDAFCAGSSTPVSRSAQGYAWLTELLEALLAPKASMAFRVRQYLENHYSEPLTLDDIAYQAGLDRYALCRAYGREEGVSVMEQLKKIRIAKAKQFLRCSSKSVEEIGILCGFESPSYFGKRFREETGRSPREYRRLHQS